MRFASTHQPAHTSGDLSRRGTAFPANKRLHVDDDDEDDVAWRLEDRNARQSAPVPWKHADDDELERMFSDPLDGVCVIVALLHSSHVL